MKLTKLLRDIFKFALDHQLLCVGDRVVVAVSGGVDSMFLLWLCDKWKEAGYISSVRVLHFNHGTRQENHFEEKLVFDFCQKMGIVFASIPLKLSNSSNFEFIAREERLEHGINFLNENELLLTAHHLNDSFEWALMQKFKSGSLKSCLGIPAKNGKIRRPLMCLSKVQILGLARKFSIPFADDPSNLDNRFERNYMRNIVIPSIKNRFPRYLEHYVEQSNQLARRLGFHLIPATAGEFETYQDALGGIWLYRESFELGFSGLEEVISSIIEKLSTAKRGVIRQQIQRAISAAEKNNNGPLLFSGGVLGYFYPGSMYFIHKSLLPRLEQADNQLLENLKIGQKYNASQIPRVDISKFNSILRERINEKNLFFPHLMIANGQEIKKFWPGLKKVDPLFPKTTAYCIEKGIYYRSALHFLHQWKKRGERFCFAICVI